MEKIGKKLKRVREEKELSKEKVYRDIKIRPEIITALEETNMEELPGPIYVKNFIKEYADYLELDPEPLLEEFSYTAKDSFKAESMKGFQPKGDYIKRWVYIKKFFYLAIVIIIFIFAFWGIKRITFLSKPTPSSVSEETSKKKEKRASSISEELLVPKNKPLTLKIRTLQDTWVQVKSDGNVVFQKVLYKDTPQKFKSQDNFEIWVGKASKVKLSLNGTPLGPLGSGVMKNILIDRSGVNLPDEK